MEFQPVFGLPAGRLDDTIFVADLQIGIDGEYRRGGITVPDPLPAMIEGLQRLPAADRLVILGDLKHEIGANRGTARRIERFSKAAGRLFDEILLVKGNHDGGLAWERHGIDLLPSSGHREGDFGWLHGHRFPRPEVLAAPIILSGHLHPAALFIEAIGIHSVEPCWFRLPGPGELDDQELVCLPSFNDLCGGTPVNERGQKLLGPLFGRQVFDKDRGRIVTLDGVELGTRQELLVNRIKRGRRIAPRKRLAYTRIGASD